MRGARGGGGGGGGGRNNIGIHGVNVAVDWNIKIYTVELRYIAEFRVHNPETSKWSERDMYEY